MPAGGRLPRRRLSRQLASIRLELVSMRARQPQVWPRRRRRRPLLAGDPFSLAANNGAVPSFGRRTRAPSLNLMAFQYQYVSRARASQVGDQVGDRLGGQLAAGLVGPSRAKPSRARSSARMTRGRGESRGARVASHRAGLRTQTVCRQRDLRDQPLASALLQPQPRPLLLLPLGSCVARDEYSHCSRGQP